MPYFKMAKMVDFMVCVFYHNRNPYRLHSFIAKITIHHNLRSAYQKHMHTSNYGGGGLRKGWLKGLKEIRCEVLDGRWVQSNCSINSSFLQLLLLLESCASVDHARSHITP